MPVSRGIGSVHDAVDDEPVELVHREAQELAEDVLAVLADAGRALERVLCPNDADRLSVDEDLEVGPSRLRGDLVVAGGGELLVLVDQVAEILDGGGRDACRLEPFGELPAVALAGSFRDQRFELILVGFARLEGGEAWV